MGFSESQASEVVADENDYSTQINTSKDKSLECLTKM